MKNSSKINRFGTPAKNCFDPRELILLGTDTIEALLRSNLESISAISEKIRNNPQQPIFPLLLSAGLDGSARFWESISEFSKIMAVAVLNDDAQDSPEKGGNRIDYEQLADLVNAQKAEPDPH